MRSVQQFQLSRQPFGNWNFIRHAQRLRPLHYIRCSKNSHNTGHRPRRRNFHVAYNGVRLRTSQKHRFECPWRPDVCEKPTLPPQEAIVFCASNGASDLLHMSWATRLSA
jgi:hypothetical protein